MRHWMQQFRAQRLTAGEAAAQLGLGVRRFYDLWRDYLLAVSRRQQHRWRPGRSGGAHRPPWPVAAQALVRKLLGARPPGSYSFVASELHRRLDWIVDRASVRRWAIRHGLATSPPKKEAQPVRRWQTQQVGQLWQYDASPHHWFGEREPSCPMLELIDDHSRVIPGVRLYPREIPLEAGLAHLEFLSGTFRAVGLPLCLYVDYHSFFFTATPEALTQLGAALHFYEISLDYAPTPQAKGKIERAHQFWQKRLPALFAAEQITRIEPANPLIEQLRCHHNRHEQHREIGMKPQAAWNLAKKEQRCVLRAAPRCPWWPYVFSVRTVVTDGAKGLHAAVREVCGSAALLQRCQWHKRENVLQYLPERHRPIFRRKLQAAYEQATYEAAKRALAKIRAELVLLNISAATSLDEGLDDTLTLHRLGVFAELGTSLKTTNTLESIHARVESRTAKVDHWKNSEQKQRWLATALLDLEPRLRRIRNYRALPLLREAIKRQMHGVKKSAA